MFRFFLIIICLSFFACGPSQDENFQDFYTGFQSNLDEHPLLQAFLEKRFVTDSTLLIPNVAEVDSTLAFAKKQLNVLHSIKQEKLSPTLFKYYQNSHSFLTLVIKHIEADKIHQKQVALYHSYAYLKNVTRLQRAPDIAMNLDHIMQFNQAAIHNLSQPDKDQLEGCVSEAIGAYEFLENDLKKHITTIDLSKKELPDLLSKIKQAQLDYKVLIGFCESVKQ